jgi:hypothetical protein
VVEGLLDLVEEGHGSVLRASTSIPDHLAALIRTTGNETLRERAAEALVRCGSPRARAIARALADDAGVGDDLSDAIQTTLAEQP